ncbi:hypothetical protein FIU95_14740 [Microbulbifer sp. THAF38]|nr:hypothetical protein FIU95_14740 [Microbulbifer sp. THAF38]
MKGLTRQATVYQDMALPVTLCKPLKSWAIYTSQAKRTRLTQKPIEIPLVLKGAKFNVYTDYNFYDQ